MFHNPSRTDRSESMQHKKPDRSGSFNQQRQFSGSVSSKGGGGTSSVPLNYSNRGVKKYNGNAPGVQSRPRSPNVSTGFSNSYTSQAVQNDAHKQQPANRVPDAPVTSSTSNVDPLDATPQQLNQVVSRPPSSDISVASPSSNPSTANSEPKAPTTPAKPPGDASRSFPLQFGSISSGFMNGVQIPAPTSSAPQNLDEQKRDQVRHQSLRTAAPAKPLSSIPKQLATKKDAGTFDQSNAGKSQPVSLSRRDTEVSAAPPMTQTQKPSVLSVPGMPMQLPFHQPQVTVQFGGPNPQIQSQSMSGTSLQLPMPVSLPLPLGNPPVQQPMFVSGRPPHPMQSQGMMHQGQALNFPSQMGPQLPPQLGNMGMNMVPQFPQQQAVKYSGSRKTVKITHPETHEELRLDGSPGLRSHSNVQPQSQHTPSIPPNHLMNFYNATSFYFPAASSVPPNRTQVPSTSQPSKIYNQVTMKPAIDPHGEKEVLKHTSSISVVKAQPLKPSKLHMDDLARQEKEIGPSSSSVLPESKPGPGTSLTSELPVLVASLEGTLRYENEDNDPNCLGLISPSPAITNEKILSSDTNVQKSVAPRGKKKKKLYKKAEAAGTSFDMYMAYKGPKKKKETATRADDLENISSSSIKLTSVDVPNQNALLTVKPAQSGVVPDDWEYSAEIPTPWLETSNNEIQSYDRDCNGLTIKQYSRDFLFKFAEQCKNLPEGFKITYVHFSREPRRSSGRNIKRPIGGSRLDRRGSDVGDEDEWSKFPGPLVSGRGDTRVDVGYVGNVAGFRNIQGGNYGVLRNPRDQTSVHNSGGILPGPIQSLGPQGGLQRNRSDSDRWRRGAGFQKGLLRSPQTPLQVMHKAEKKYEIGMVTDEEEA